MRDSAHRDELQRLEEQRRKLLLQELELELRLEEMKSKLPGVIDDPSLLSPPPAKPAPNDEQP